MKKVALFILSLYLVSIFPTQVFAQEVKIGYVDTVKLFSEYKETVQAEETYKKEVDAWKKKASEMESELAQLRDEIQSQSLMLSEDKLAEKKLIFEKKLKEYKQYMDDIFGDNGQAAKRNKELTQPIVEKINAVIAKIAEEEGYTIILDSGQGNILFAKKELDLTDKVLERLQSQFESNK